MIDDIFMFITDYILTPFVCLILVLFIGFCVVGVFMIPSCIREEQEQERKIEECFKQEPRTKDCEYMIWKYELKKREPKHTTTVAPMPIIVR